MTTTRRLSLHAIFTLRPAGLRTAFAGTWAALLLALLPGQGRGEIVAWGRNAEGQTTVPAAAQSGVTAVAGGAFYTVALKSNGSVLGWGENIAAVTTVPPEAQSGVSAIAAGSDHVVALKSDGSVVAWGDNVYGQTTLPVGVQSGVIAIAAGQYHNVALKSDGSVIAWGDTSSGQTTVPATALSDVVAVAAGASHTVALKSDGSVVAWGGNSQGQRTVPPEAQSGVIAIAAGIYHNVALKSDGRVLAWGDNSEGQTIVPAGALSGVIAIAAGAFYNVALKSDGSVLAWGDNDFGQATVPAGAPSGVTAIAAGYYHTLALKGALPVVAWGRNVEGQATVPPGGQADVKAIAAGDLHTAALKSDGSVLAWGNNVEGQTTVPPGALSGVTALAAGQKHTVALKSDGSVVAWGLNGNGQTTVPPGALSDVIGIAAGEFHSVALKSDGSVLAWGFNGQGQTTVPAAALSGVKAIAAGLYHTVALKTDGSVVAWGNDGNGQSTPPTGALSGVIAIAAGAYNTMVLKSDGSVLVWGYNGDGQTNVPAGALSGVIAIASGRLHIVALRSDGRVVAWAYNSDGQTIVPAGARSGATAIAAGYNHTVALAESDTTPPETTITSTQPTPTNSTGATITFTGTDDLAAAASLTFEGRLDSAAFATVTSPVTLSGLADGTHSYEVRATDAVGNVDASPAMVTWTVDTVPPTFTLPEPIAVLTTSLAGVVVDYTASASDTGGSGVASSSFLPAGGSSFPLGTTTVDASATDNAGNTATGSFTVAVHLAAPVSTVVLAKGADAPGRLTSADLPDDAVIASFGTPVTDDAGNIAFTAKWTSPTGGKGAGLFTDTKCLGLVGGVVQNGTNRIFKSFGDPVLHSGNIACLATLAGEREGSTILLTGPVTGPLGASISIGIPAAGANGATFKKLKSIAVVGSHVGFLAQLTVGTGTPKVTAANDLGLWVKDGSNPLVLALREGQMIGQKTIKTLVSFIGGNGSPGCGRGWLVENPTDGALILSLVKFTDGTQAVVQAQVGAGAAAITLAGDAATGLDTGATFASYSVPARNSDETTTFLGKLTIGSGVTRADASGVFLSDGTGKFTKIVRTGDDAVQGAKFGLLKDPVLASDGGIAFPATIKGGTVRGAAMQTLWWQPPGVALRLLAQGGSDAAELPGLKWKSFTSLAIAGERGPMFVATFTPGHAQSGVWAIDFAGATRLLFRTGVPITDGGKTVKSFTLLNATVGSTGLTRSFNDAGQVVWLATFVDKTTAIVVTEVP